MPPFLLALPVIGLGFYLWKTHSSHPADSMTFTEADANKPATPPATVIPPASSNAPIDTLTLAPPLASAVPSNVPPPAQPTGQKVTTPPTATEGPQTLPLLDPPNQPKMPSADAIAVAKAFAPKLAELLRTNAFGDNYVAPGPSHPNGKNVVMLIDSVKKFQTLAGLVPDGLYGPSAAGALMYFLGGQPPPPPFFFAPGPRAIKVYKPRA